IWRWLLDRQNNCSGMMIAPLFCWRTVHLSALVWWLARMARNRGCGGSVILASIIGLTVNKALSLILSAKNRIMAWRINGLLKSWVSLLCCHCPVTVCRWFGLHRTRWRRL